MSKSRGFFLLTGIAELMFALFTFAKPLGYAEYSLVINGLFNFDIFMLVMLILSLISTVLVMMHKTYRITTLISSFLSAQWFLICISPFITGFYTMALPLLIYFFVMRILTTVSIEEGVRGDRLWI